MGTPGTATVQAMAEHALLAPSSHNTQPWRFRLADDRFELYADRTRSLPVNDPHDRELVISCGAALLNARLAAGAGAAVELFPDGEQAALLARVSASGGAPPDEPLLAAVAARRTTRERFADRAVPKAIEARLVSAAATEGARLEILDDERRHTLAGLVAVGDRAQFADPRWRRELASWMRRRSAGDGLAHSALRAAALRFAVRRFDVGARTAASDERLTASAPLAAMLATADDGIADWLVAGQALQRVLLEAAAAGIQAGFLNQPIQVARLRPRVAGLLAGGGRPQIAVRLGYPRGELRAAPRRPLTAVVSSG